MLAVSQLATTISVNTNETATATNLTWYPTNAPIYIFTNVSEYAYTYPQYKAANIQDKNITGIKCESNAVTLIDFGPALTNDSISIEVYRCTNLTLVTGSSPITIPSTSSLFKFLYNDSLTNITLTNMTMTGCSFDASFCPALTTVNLPNWLPESENQDGAVDLRSCALTAATVNHILARCVAADNFLENEVYLDGGTSASPTGQGITDKSTLEADDNIIHVN
jgi:hypothetical protein